MTRLERIALVAIPATIAVGAGVAFAGSSASTRVFGIPLFGILVGLAFVIQWIVFIPAFLIQSERFFDITGSITYVSVTVLGFLFAPVTDARGVLILSLVVIWAGRLGPFLFARVRSAGKDGRFDTLKPSFLAFFNVWNLQGLWVTFTIAAALAALTTVVRKPIGAWAIIGAMLWLAGFVIEAVSDAQKSRFRKNPENRGRYITSGLWAWSRHPNYFGEIVIWTGIAVIALPVLRGFQLVTLISPLFVTLLLTKISGIPMLEKRADERWGGEEGYESYKRNTPVLVPRPPRR